MLNSTHDAGLRSWVVSANRPGHDFPIQNLPFGVFSTATRTARGGVAIGDMIVDLAALLDAGVLGGEMAPVLEAASEAPLNRFVSMGNMASSGLRSALSAWLSGPEPDSDLASSVLVSAVDATMHLPVAIGGFTDFMTSVHHVTAARRSRPARPLNDNFLHLPVAYNSRASSITVDGVPMSRPWGQRREPNGDVIYAPTAQLDFEVEFGAIVGTGNALGTRVTLDDADDHIFGYVLVNDWSARDIQIWEQRLGPFLGKAFRTTISPWIVTAEAVAPFRVPAPARDEDQPKPLPYLDSETHRGTGGLDIDLEASLQTRAMRDKGQPGTRIVKSRLMDCAWTLPQMLTHQTSGGCNLQPGDLLSSGTVSGPTDESAACMFEITAGTLPIDLPNGETRTWIEDGDEFVITGSASADGYQRIGFGRCGAIILAAEPA